MRSIVLEKRANASRPGALQFSLVNIKTLTDAPSRKTTLSEKSETDRISRANMNSRQKKRKWAAARGEIRLKKFWYLASGVRRGLFSMRWE